MITKPPFLQDFEEQMKISVAVSQQHRYKQNFGSEFALNHISSDQGQKQHKLSVNLSFTPRDVTNNKRKISQKYQLLLKQMKDEEIQRKLKMRRNKRKQQSVSHEEQDEVDAFVNEKIQEYNDLIDHNNFQKNLKQVKINDEKKTKIQANESTSQTDSLLSLIKKQQNQLKQCKKLTDRYAKNKQICQNYHRISLSLKPQNKQRDSPRLTRNNISNFSKLSEGISMDNPSMKTSQYDQKIRNSGIFLKKTSRYSSPPVETSPKKLQFNLKQPYLTEKALKKSNELNQQLRIYEQRQQLWKHRLSEHEIRFKQSRHKRKISEFKQAAAIIRKSSDPEINQFQTAISQFPQLSQYIQSIQIDASDLSQNTCNKSQTENLGNKYLSQYLSRHNPKFLKVKGNNNNKIMLKFDSVNIARSMLQGDPSLYNKDDQQQLKKNIAKKEIKYESMHSRRFRKPQNLPADQSSIVDYMLEEEGDIYYWTTCRNEQINLLIKGGRNHKNKENNKAKENNHY